jgi:putative NIF3 family GTP cyclohydrolase 1 type 2
VLTLHIYPELAQEPTWERSYPENPKLLRYLNDVDALCRWRDAHAPGKEVWITEFGYDSSTKKADPHGEMPQWVGVTDEQQAQWLVRSILVFAAMPVERAYVYFFNDRDVPSLHKSAGLTRHFRPKPSFHALAHLQRVLGDFRFQRVVTDEPDRLRVQEFTHETDPSRIVWAVWSPTGNGTVAKRTLAHVPGRLERVERMPLEGGAAKPEAAVVQKADGSIDVEVTESPLYLVMKRTPMTARELNGWLRSLYSVPEPSVDRVIVGDPETVVRGVAVLWMPTWAALREALAKGCNVVVAHEPTFFSHHDLDAFENDAGQLSPAALKAMSGTRDEKRRWIEENGMVVIRCHDVLDRMPGGVADALTEALGFDPANFLVNEPYYRVLKLEPGVRAGELAQKMATVFGQIGQPGVAFYGDPERVVKKLGLGTGYACDPFHFVQLGADMCVTIDDRIKTWIETEWADDAGFPMIVIHHGTSEEWGVRRLQEIIAEKFPDLTVRLLPQGFRARWIPAKDKRDD